MDTLDENLFVFDGVGMFGTFYAPSNIMNCLVSDNRILKVFRPPADYSKQTLYVTSSKTYSVLGSQTTTITPALNFPLGVFTINWPTLRLLIHPDPNKNRMYSISFTRI